MTSPDPAKVRAFAYPDTLAEAAHGLLRTLAAIRRRNDAMLARMGVPRAEWEAMTIPQREVLIRRDRRLTSPPG